MAQHCVQLHLGLGQRCRRFRQIHQTISQDSLATVCIMSSSLMLFDLRNMPYDSNAFATLTFY
jgi:hypothetical protein